MVRFEGKYRRYREEGYVDILNKLDVNVVLRKIATTSNPTLHVTQTSPGKWSFVIASLMKKFETNFELDVEFEEKTPDGRLCRTTVTQPDEKTWVFHQKAVKPTDKDTKVIRRFFDNRLESEIICEEAICKEFFERAK